MDLSKLLLTEIGKGNYIFTVTNLNYISDSSGTSKVVKAHQDLFAMNKINFIAIFPICKTFLKRKPPLTIKSGCFGLILNGKYVGVTTIAQILKALVELQKSQHYCSGILLHSLHRSSIPLIHDLVDHIENVPVVFYIHDYYAYCTNPRLTKNNRSFCAGKENCSECYYGNQQKKHYPKIKKLLASCKDRLTCVAPAEYTKNIWLDLFPEYANKMIVIPHQMAKGEYEPTNLITDTDTKLRVGYVGAQKEEKGWKIWKHLISSRQSQNYEFYYFGNGKECIRNVTNVCVEVAKQGKNAMMEALREQGVHIAFLGSLCPETYSYTMYESHAGNCFIVTLKCSGNIAYTVKKDEYGVVCKDENELLELFSDAEKLKEQVSVWQRKQIIPNEYTDNDAILSLFNVQIQGYVKATKSDPFLNVLARLTDCAYRVARM